LEGGVLLGIAARVWPRVSLTFAGDLALILNSSVFFIPGLQVGITLH
jgi:hypothetical protein